MIDLDEELDNWRRTVRVGRVIHFCGSAEKHYRPERELLDLTGDAPEAIIPLRVRDGWHTEFCWRHVPDFRLKLLLSYHYIRNMPARTAALRAKLPGDRARVEAALVMARQLLKDRLLSNSFRL